MVRELLAFPGVEARRRLVEAEEPRLRGERARDPDELALPLREVLGHRVRRFASPRSSSAASAAFVLVTGLESVSLTVAQVDGW